MNSRNRRRNRQASMKARLGLAGAVLVGGGAAGVAVAASHGPATTDASAAGYIMGIQHHIPASQALSGALSTWGKTNASHQRALSMLAQMNPMRNFNQVWGPRHTRFAHTQFAAQRGVVTAMGTVRNRTFVVVRSSNGQMKVWWLSGKTALVNAATNNTAMATLTGNNNAAVQAAVNKNTMPAMNQVAGNAAVVNKAAAGSFSFTGTFTINGQTFTITINATTGAGTVTPTTMPATGTGTATAPATGMGTTTATAPATGMGTTTATAPATGMGTTTPTAPATMPITVKSIVKGDLVFITGVRSHGQLSAQLLILLKAAVTATPAPGASTGQTMTVSPSTPASNGAHL
ncbi:MAG TPA: hypothetical protein VH589_05720 [Trebonia sp.]